MSIKHLLKRSALALSFLMGFALSTYAQSNNQGQNNQSGINVRSLRSDGSKSSDLGYERLGDLCDSLQLALNLPIREVLPVQKNGNKSNKRLNEKELRLTLTEIFNALGIEVNLPTRFTPGNLDVIFYSIIGPPSMTITSTEVADGGATFQGSIGLTFTSTKETSDFTEADIALTNGTLSGFTGAGKTYTATFTPEDEGTCMVSIAEGTFSVENGKANVAAFEFVWTHDTTSPSVAIASVEVTNGAITSDATLSLTFTTSESTSNFDETVIAVTNGTLSSFAGSGMNYSATFTPDGVGVCTIQIVNDAFTDLAGNGNTVSEEFIWTHAFAPTVDTYDEFNSNAGYWAELSASFTDGGSEVTMTGFLYSTNPDFLTTMSFGNELTSPFSGSLSFLSGSTQYWVAAFAENAIGRSYGDTITVTSLPRMAITAAEVADGGTTSSPTLSLTFTASESTTDFDETDITVSNGLAVLDGTLTEFTGSGTTYTATFTQVGYYNYAINVGQGAFPGPSGNLNTAAPEFNWTYASSPTVDTEDPTSVTDLAATLNGTFTKNGSNVTATGFKYGTDALLSNPTDLPGNGTTSPFTGSLTGLTHSTQYWAVSYATNAMGTSYGDTISFTTLVTPAVFVNCGDEIYYDGHNYATVQIGDLCWFAENLGNDDYNDETPIAGNLVDAAWEGTNEGAQAIHDEGGANEASNLAAYGRLYNWHAVNTGKLCPTGWHVPTDEEWTTFETDQGGATVAGDKLKSTTGWSSDDAGTNSSGFNGLPGGLRYDNGNFHGLVGYGSWWSSSIDGSSAVLRDVYSGYPSLYRSLSSYNYGHSVRCIKNPEPLTVDTDAATSVTNEMATLNATITSGGNSATSTGFKYGTDPLLSSPTDVPGIETTSPFSAAITGLSASTPYWAVAYATNLEGTSYGDTITFTTCGEPAVFNNCGDAISYNCYNYSTVSISGQCWFAENLRSEYYNNGTAIASGLDDSAWSANTEGAVAVNGEGGPNEASNLADYGRLYNWHAVNTGNLCPSGWHVPTYDDWTTMINTAGFWGIVGGKMKSAAPGWNGSNTLQFNGLPGGKRQNWGPFETPGTLGTECSWWSSSPESDNNAYVRKLFSGNAAVLSDYKDKKDGFSVRCIQDLD